MTENEEYDGKLKKFISITFLGIFIACIVGFVGGWMLYQDLQPGTTAFRIELLVPTIIATVIMCIALSLVKKKMFGSKENFQAAAERFKKKHEQAKK